MYELFKAYPGPFATIFASVAATAIASWFGYSQVQVARRLAVIADVQAQTALDQLRYNLFERRYAIYHETQAFLKMFYSRGFVEDFHVMEIASFYVTLEEALFFYSNKVCDWLLALKKDVENFIEQRQDQRTPAFLEAAHALIIRKQEMPKIFGSELQFRQLTGR